MVTLRMLKLDMLAGGIVKIPEIAIPVTQDPASPYFINSSEKTSQPIVLPPFPKDLPSFRLRVFPKDLPSFALFLIWQNKFPYLTLSCHYHMVHHYIINSILLPFSLLL